MKFSALIILAAAALLSGCSQSKPAVENTNPKDQVEQLRHQAGSAMLAEATNEVPGIRSIIRTDAFTDGDAIAKWTGLVTLDYVNHNGGIDRTNLHMVLTSMNGRLWAHSDYDYYLSQTRDEIAAREKKLVTH